MPHEEVKIYRKAQDTKNPVVTEADRAANEYRRHSENGNLQRAHLLGAAMVDCFLGMQVGQEFAAQKWVLLSYLAKNLLEQGIEDPLLQKSALGKFNSTLSESAPELSQIIHDSRAYTLYSLNEKRLRARSEGEIFAELCERPGDAVLIADGEQLAKIFEDKITAEIGKTVFVP